MLALIVSIYFFFCVLLLVYKQNIIFDILIDTILLKSVSVINACIVHMILMTCSK